MIVYNSKEEALKGISAHEFIQSEIDLKGQCYFQCGGWIKLDDTVILWSDRDSFYGNGINIVTDKSISMFLPIRHNHKIKGFTAHYEDVTKECAVVQYGGDERNIGGHYVNHLGTLMKHFRPRRTNSVANDLDFDLEGKAIGVWVNFDDPTEDKNSHCHFLKVRGNYKNCDIPIKIDRNYISQSLNTFDIKLIIWGANKFADINDINHSEISIIGQETEENNEEAFNITGRNIILDLFTYDIAKYNPDYTGKITDVRMGNLNINGLYMKGMLKIKSYKVKDTWKAYNTNFNESIVIE